ncbi:MAG TPA: sensor domain-containing diguanylate cyclase [Burkholderiaceae bacterium]|nr:sensor domain-containing diguanylate cyclase [Burkholderiaceae bacterium]
MIQPVYSDIFSEVETKSQGRRLLIIAWLFVAIMAVVLAFTFFSIGIMSAGRAYVGGEGLWSKAQKEMIYSLARYAHYHDEMYYQAYLKSLAVSRGDHQARIELEKTNPDLRIAAAGFIQGRNHPDDVDGMISLFRNFRRVPEIDKAIDIWARADTYIEQVMQIADQIHAGVQAGTMDDARALPYLQKLYEINSALIPMEDYFSYTLGLASRKTQTIVLFVLFAVVSVLVTGAYLFSKRLMRQSEHVHNALRAAGLQFRSLLNSAPLSIVINGFDEDIVFYANEHALRQFKVSSKAIGQLRVSSFYVKSEDREAFKAALRADGVLRDWEVQLQDSTGTPFWSLISCQFIAYEGKQCIFSALSNIDARKRSHEEMQYRAFHDELTSLPNRAMFMESTRKLIANANPEHDVFAILFIDLDRFKLINDELGHEVGDRLLQQVALRLQANVGPEDIVSRLGGDEFVVLIEVKTDFDAVRKTADKIVQAIAPTFSIGTNEVNISTSIGISCYPQDGTDLMSLVKNADVAMYQAKDEGRNNAQFYSVTFEQNQADKSVNRFS